MLDLVIIPRSDSYLVIPFNLCLNVSMRLSLSRNCIDIDVIISCSVSISLCFSPSDENNSFSVTVKNIHHNNNNNNSNYINSHSFLLRVSINCSICTVLALFILAFVSNDCFNCFNSDSIYKREQDSIQYVLLTAQ